MKGIYQELFSLLSFVMFRCKQLINHTGYLIASQPTLNNDGE